MIQPLILSCGSRLLLEPRRESPGFTLAVVFPFGSRNEAPATRGFMHFIEHMLFKGTSGHDAYSLWRLMERTGGYVNGFTERDSVCLYCSVPASDMDVAVGLMAEMAFSSTFAEKELENERNVILSEIKEGEDDLEETAYDAFLGRLWEGNPASRRIAGEPGEVEAIGRDALYDFYLSNFVPGNAILIASGQFDPGLCAGKIERAIRAAGSFAGRAKDGVSFPVESLTPVAHRVNGFRRAGRGQAYCLSALQMNPPFKRGDYYSTGIFCSILGEASTSRLFQRLREREGLVYTVLSTEAFTRTECLLVIQAIADADKAETCVREIDEELDAMLKGGIREEELDDARRRLAGSSRLALEDPESRIRRIGRSYLWEGSALEAEEEARMFEAVGMDDIKALSGRLLAAERSRFVYGSVKAQSARGLHLVEM